ncbi:MAG: bifunctional oligoribonuclease/PAP phosphatase NrnA [Candidatus Omnitrophota bacterium]
MVKNQVLKKIKNSESILISTHVNPDGDALGCQLALARLIKIMGKKLRIVNEDSIPQVYEFLPECNIIERYDTIDPAKLDFDLVLIVDCPNLKRIGRVNDLIKDQPVINIDHHVSNEKFGDINWIDPHVSSVGEMVYDLFKTSGIELDDSSALYLYVSIMTDTGSFRYSNTTSATHTIAADLLPFNIHPKEIYGYIYEKKSFAEMKLLGEILNGLQRTNDGKIAWIKLTNQMLQRNDLMPESADDVIDYVRMIEGVEVAAFLRELDVENSVKVSLRSKTKIDVNEIAAYFGGGGHSAAAGCVIKKDMAEAEHIIIEQIKKSVEANAAE